MNLSMSELNHSAGHSMSSSAAGLCQNAVMTEDVWIAVITGAAALVGALLGVLGTLGATALANRSRRIENEELRERQARDAARVAIHDLLLQGRRWIEVVAPHGPVMLTKQTHEQRRTYLDAAADGGTVEEARDEFIRAVTNAQLLVADEVLRGEIDSLVSASGYWVTDLLLPSYTDPRAGQVGRLPRDGEWEDVEAAFKAHLQSVADIASNITAVELRR